MPCAGWPTAPKRFDVGFAKLKKLTRRLEIKLKNSSRNNEMTTCHHVLLYINKSQVSSIVHSAPRLLVELTFLRDPAEKWKIEINRNSHIWYQNGNFIAINPQVSLHLLACFPKKCPSKPSPNIPCCLNRPGPRQLPRFFLHHGLDFLLFGHDVLLQLHQICT